MANTKPTRLFFGEHLPAQSSDLGVGRRGILDAPRMMLVADFSRP
jgi:hypothetical protein